MFEKIYSISVQIKRSFLSWLSSYCNCFGTIPNCFVCFPYSSMNSMLSWVILFLLVYNLGGFAVTIIYLFIYPNSLAIENTFFCCIFYKPCIILYGLHFLVVKRWSEIDLNICINNANSLVIIFRLNFQNIDLKFARECLNSYCISFVQAGKVPELIFKHCFWII